MSVVRTARAMINCDTLGCRQLYQGSRGCDYAVEVRTEARAEGWRVNVPRDRGPSHLNPQSSTNSRLDFCPQHVESETR